MTRSIIGKENPKSVGRKIWPMEKENAIKAMIAVCINAIA